MSNTLSQNITVGSLLKFTFPTVIMMVFMSMYTIVDGIFVARLINTDALSAVNIVYPLISVALAVGIMLGTGASAIIARKQGEGKIQEGNRNMTFIILVSLMLGILLATLILIFMRPILYFLGANDAIYQYCYRYMVPLAFFCPASILQLQFQFLFVTAGKPKLGLVVTILGGVANIVLDYLFIGVLGMDIAGAAYATGIGYSIPAVAGLIFFGFRRGEVLRFVKPTADWRVLLQSCANGSSEMVSNLSAAVIAYLFNILMMHFLGQDGVAAITIVLYAEFLLVAVSLGYSSGVAPLVSYNYGSGDNEKLRKIYRISLWFIGGFSALVFVLSLLMADSIVTFFAPQTSPVHAFAVKGFYLYSFCYLFKGYNIFASALFTAFSNGRVSAILSFMRTLVLIVASMLLLTWRLGVDGVWLSVPVAELLAAGMSFWYLRKLRDVYHYA